jgi:chromosome segregation ATPase
MSTRAALAIVIAFAGCKPESARKADRAAKDVIEQRADLKKAEQPDQVAVERKELSAAAQQFTESKRIRIAALRGEHSVIATQIRLISTLTEYSRITDGGRADINNKLSAFQMRLDEAKNQIEGLAGAAADAWEQRDDAVRDAMDALESARKAAWRSLDDAPRIHPNAS